MAHAADAFEGGTKPAKVVDLAPLHAKIGQLTLEMIFGKRAHQSWIAERKAMIDRDHKLPVTQQAKLLKVSRSAAY